MPTISSSIKNGQQSQFKAGGQVIAVNDMVQIGGPGLKAYPVKTIDYAIKSAVTTILAQTSASSSTVAGFDRQAAVTDQYGNIYVATPASGGTVSKYGPVPTGSALATAGGLTAASSGNFKLFFLSNGYLCVLSSVIATGAISFAIIDTQCNVVKASTAVGTSFNATSVTYFDACALSGGGGFAVSYLSSAGTQISLQTYDNTGTAVLAATNVQTFGGTPTLVYTKLSQLSSGNLLVSFKSPTATPAGLTFVVVSTAGVSVKTNVVVDATAAAGFHDHAVMTGFFTVAAPNGANVKCSVYDNTGTISGGQFSAANTQNPTTYSQIRIVTDGAQFWLCYVDASTTKCIQIPTSGTNFVTGAAGSVGGLTFSLDAATNGGLLMVFLAATDTAASKLYYVQLPDAEMGVKAATQINNTTVTTAAATTGTLWPRLLFSGDFTGVLVYDKQNVAGIFVAIYKVDTSAIEGVSQSANAVASPGSYGAANTINVNPGPGMYSCNFMAGTSGSGFNHSSTAPAGTNGKLFNNSAAMSGAGVPRQIN